MSDNVTSAENETPDYTDFTDSNPVTDYTQVVCSTERKPTENRKQLLADSNDMDQGEVEKSRSFFSRLFKPG
jgi:hypothetical protein